MGRPLIRRQFVSMALAATFAAAPASAQFGPQQQNPGLGVEGGAPGTVVPPVGPGYGAPGTVVPVMPMNPTSPSVTNVVPPGGSITPGAPNLVTPGATYNSGASGAGSVPGVSPAPGMPGAVGTNPGTVPGLGVGRMPAPSGLGVAPGPSPVVPPSPIPGALPGNNPAYPDNSLYPNGTNSTLYPNTGLYPNNRYPGGNAPNAPFVP